MSRVLVTGGAGFIGTNLADRLLEDGHSVRVVDNLARPGVERNLTWLQQRHGDRLEVMIGDLCEMSVAMNAVSGVDSVFHLAAQVAVTTSLDDPVFDFDVNLLEVIERIAALSGEGPEVRFGPWRQGDQRYYVTDTSRFQQDTGWRPRVDAEEGIERLYDWLHAEAGVESRLGAQPSAV